MHVPSYEVFGVVTDVDVIREVKALLPANNLAVDVLPVLCAEGRPAYETLKHDRAEGPLFPQDQRLSQASQWNTAGR